MLFTSRVCPVAGARARCVVLLLLASISSPVQGESGSLDGQVTLEWAASPDPGITGYKLYYGTQSGIYSEILDIGGNLEAELSGLAAGSTYYCNVTAYNSSGLESPFSEEFSFSYDPPVAVTYPTDQLVLLDAAGTGGPMMVFDFEISMEADYVVWCRFKAPDPDNDTLLVTLDGGPEEVFQVPSPLSPDWVWTPVRIGGGPARVYSLGEGSHALTIVLPAGAQLDRLVLTSAPYFHPSDDLPRSGEAVVITHQPTGRSIRSGAATTFSVCAVATGPVSYQWRRNGLDLPGANTRDLAISGATPADAGDYSVVIRSGTAAQLSSAAILQVVTAPTTLGVTLLSATPEGMVTFDVQGGIGDSLEVFASSDMVTWQSIATVTNSDGTIAVADPQAFGECRRFYRFDKAVGK